MSMLDSAFDPEAFRKLGHELIDHFAHYLKSTMKGEGPVHSWKAPEARKQGWKAELDSSRDLFSIFKKYSSEAQHLHHPHYVGHQMGVPLPLTALADLAVSVLNNSVAIYEMGPSATMIESTVMEWLRERVGYGPNGEGIFTSGGTLGNLTALLSARQKKLSGNSWKEGIVGSQVNPTILVSDQAHYSIERAVRIMGWGEKGISKVPVENFRMDTTRLEEAFSLAESQRKKVIAVVANTCSTATGTFDSINAIADFAEKKNLWLHVDGAHGGAAVFSSKYKDRVRGLERADSIVLDPHKMMLTPALTTLVLYKEKKDSLATFNTEAPYLFQKSAEEEWYNPCHRTLECTKRDFTFRLFVLLAAYGPKLFDEYVTRQFDLAVEFADMIEKHPDFELPLRPESNIVCFRLKQLDRKRSDVLHPKIRQALTESGKFYLVQTTLPSGIYLRTTLMNPFTATTDLTLLLKEIQKLGRELG